MNKFYTPNIVVSKCLNFENCRYNWDKINDDFVSKLKIFVNFIPVCPEVWIWLWIPRLPLRLALENEKIILVQPATNLDLTSKMSDFCNKFLDKQENIDWFIMKNRSPSCWINDVKLYHKRDSYTILKKTNPWIFWSIIKTRFKNIPLEDEWRLKSFKIREEFLTKIFCLAEFREISKLQKISVLSEFQAKNKYLFMAYSPAKQVKLGQILASYNKTNFLEIKREYYNLLLDLFNTKSSVWKTINALTHIFWYFKDLSSDEKVFIKETLDIYKEGRIPTSWVMQVVKAYAIKQNQSYILNQSILNPFPRELIELSDSWRVLEL